MNKQSQPPVKDKEQHQKSDQGSHGAALIGKLMRKIGLGGAGTLMNDLAQLTAAEAFGEAERQLLYGGK